MTATIQQQLLEIPLDQLHPSADNPRRDVGDLVELATSIRSMGIIEPLVVTPNGNGYIVVAGHRRLAAAELAALDTVPCVVRDLDDKERLAAMLVENLQRTDLAPLEEATAFRRLIDEFGYSQRDLAEKVGRSQGHISKRLTLLGLPAKVLKALDSGGITLEDARALTQLVNMPGRLDAAWKFGVECGDIQRAVSTQLRQHEEDVKREATAAELKAKGVRLIETNRDQWGQIRMPHELLRLDGYEAGELGLTKAKHAKLACHAAYVSPEGGAIFVCTNRRAHAPVRRPASPAQKKYRDHEKALREAREARRAVAASFLGGKIAAATTLDLVVGAFMQRAEAEAKKVAAQLLGLEPKTDPRSTYKDYGSALEEFAGKSDANRIKAAAAVALATDEIQCAAGWARWGKDEKRYLNFLAGHGHKISAAEKLELAGKAPNPARSY
jgi:ParB/RepB/Spo0J family partition protein